MRHDVVAALRGHVLSRVWSWSTVLTLVRIVGVLPRTFDFDPVAGWVPISRILEPMQLDRGNRPVRALAYRTPAGRQIIRDAIAASSAA
jgi:hypothetical protein